MKKTKVSISGSIGVSFLKNINDNKKVTIFYDDHSNTKYCDSSYFIDNFFETVNNYYKKSIILLEEPFLSNMDNVMFLWQNIPHVIKSKNFYKKIVNKCNNEKICRVFPIDIRLCLVDVSIEEYIPEENDEELLEMLGAEGSVNKFTDVLNNVNKNVKKKISLQPCRKKCLEKNLIQKDTVKNYFKYFIFLFDCDKVNSEYFKDNSNIFFLKDVFDNFSKTKYSSYYFKVKEQFNKFYLKFIKPNYDLEMINFISQFKNQIFIYKKGFPYENDNENNFISQFNRIHNSLMELYSVIIITSSHNPNIIIYCGYYHSNNICYILEKYMGFEVNKNLGVVDDIDENEEKSVSCLNIDQKLLIEYI